MGVTEWVPMVVGGGKVGVEGPTVPIGDGIWYHNIGSESRV